MSEPQHTRVFFNFVSLLFLLFAYPALAQKQTDGWILKNEKDAIKVYYRKTAGIYELKLATSIKVSLSSMAHLLDEVNDYPVWGYKVSEARLLKRVSPTELYYYTKIDFPWPLSDRDVIMHTRTEQDPHTRALHSISTALPDYIPGVADVVRIPKASIQWTVIPGNGGWAYIEYYLYSDPGGNLPDWVVNMALDVGPRETFKRMREILKTPGYQNTKLAHIRE